ncbi:SDR family oxidoreductase [Lentzea sp. NPDC051213]|uniref:SDR family oxidoreductase n=1 Tax=Lentzea sp. NPDC051213 TaxID=3364126 RepID=UPI0037BA9205
MTDDDQTRILGLHWEKTEFEPWPGAAVGTEWVLLSWGPSRAADALAVVLGDEGAGVRRADLATEDVGATVSREGTRGAFVRLPSTEGPRVRQEAGARYVLFLDETVPMTGSGATNWDWAHAAVRLCQQVASQPGAKLWIVTRTGLHGPGTHEVTRPEHDFAWALGRCHAAESFESWGGLVDLDVDDPATAGRMLADHLLSDSGEDEVLLRDDGPLVARLRASTLPPTASGQGLSPERLHVVSGGATGLSFEVARWLARRGAKRLLILGRSPLDADRERNLRLLESLGCAAKYEVLDVGDPTAVHALTDRLRGDPLGGVFHLASNWRLDGQSCVTSLKTATDEQIEVLLGAKASGALLLSQLAEDLGAEAMVLFSSAAATLGSPGQAGYAAANAVLDGVARRLHRGRVRAVSIAWGPIGEVGFGATREGSQLHDVWERLGLRRLTVDQVLSTVGMALAQDEPNLTVAAWDESADLLAGARPVLEALVATEPQGLSLERLGDQADRVGFIVEVVREHLARMLSCAPQEVDPGKALGSLEIDSLIALEMLFVIEREFAVRLGLDEVLAGMDNTLVAMAELLDQRIREDGR